MNRRTRIRYTGLGAIATSAIAIGASAALLTATAIPASASSGLCWVGGNSAARLSATRYPYGSGFQIHADLNSAGIYKQSAIYIGGVKVTGTNDVYKNVTSGVHTVTGEWLYPMQEMWKSITCSIYLS